MSNALYSLSEQIGSCLLKREHTLVIAESCTGGWISKCITDVPGSSSWFDQGFVTYSDQAKMESLSVQHKTIERYGAVSENTVREMVAGALARTNASIAVGVTGIAGPSGGSTDKPIGTVWFGWQIRACSFHSERAQFEGDRDSVRRETVRLALDGILRVYGD